MNPKALSVFFAVSLCLFFASFVYADTSNISKLVFTTAEQTVKPNEISDKITIQIQDASSMPATALETIRFNAFQTTSPTGVFVSCTTPANPPTDYLSKGGSNKNICYKDSTEGAYVITVSTSNTVSPLSVSQPITISSGTGDEATTTPPDTTSTSTDTVATTTATSTQTTTLSSGTSWVYSSSVSLSADVAASTVIDAGRERVAFLHSPVEFKTNAIDMKSGKSVYGATYTWSFGDGFSESGNVVSHTYMFPGEYVVVLNSSVDGHDMVDVTKVKVIEPKVSVRYNSDYIELSNNLDTDMNIGGWKFIGNSKEYIIPRDTIVLGKGSIKIPRVALGHAGETKEVSFLYPDNQKAFENSFIDEEDENKKEIERLSLALADAKHRLASLSVQDTPEKPLSVTKTIQEEIASSTESTEDIAPPETHINQTKPSKPLIQRLFDYLVGITK